MAVSDTFPPAGRLWATRSTATIQTDVVPPGVACHAGSPLDYGVYSEFDRAARREERVERDLAEPLHAARGVARWREGFLFLWPSPKRGATRLGDGAAASAFAAVARCAWWAGAARRQAPSPRRRSRRRPLQRIRPARRPDGSIGPDHLHNEMGVLVLGVGNPLLDISSKVPMDVLEKYEVKSGK